MYSTYYGRGEKRTGTMIATTIVVFFLSLSALSSIGWVPSYVDGVSPDPLADAALPDANDNLALSSLPQLGVSKSYTPASTEPVAKPTRIVAHSIGLDLPVLNPEGTAVSVLDEALLSGTVRYPLSAELNEEGNILIFAHSSRIPVVKNQMFKAFNRISELREGDTIKLVGEAGEKNSAHIYRVSSVRRTDASEALINLSLDQGRRLTLSTCDSFGGKSSRFVVEAEYVGSYSDE